MESMNIQQLRVGYSLAAIKNIEIARETNTNLGVVAVAPQSSIMEPIKNLTLVIIIQKQYNLL